MIKGGKCTIRDQPITLRVSQNKRYPTSQGWLSFYFEFTTYFIKITKYGVSMVEMDPGVDIDTAELTEIPQARK